MFLRCIFLLLISSVTNAAGIVVDVDFLNHPNIEDVYPIDHYSDPDVNLHSMQRLGLLSEEEANSSRLVFNKDNTLTVWTQTNPLTKLTVSQAGESQEYNYPSLNAPNIQSFYNVIVPKIESNNIYVFDEHNNSIFYFHDSTRLWFNLRDHNVFPDGDINQVYFKDNTLILVFRNENQCSVWRFLDSFEKIMEFSSCGKSSGTESYKDEDGEYFSKTFISGLINVNKDMIWLKQELTLNDKQSFFASVQKLDGASMELTLHKEEVSHGEEFQYDYRSLYLGDGVMYVPLNTKLNDVLWYDVSKNQLISLHLPKLAESLVHCTDSFNGMFCFFNMGEDIYAAYRLKEKEFSLDSVFDLSVVSDYEYAVGLAGIYGESRLLNVNISGSSLDIEVSKYNSTILHKSERGAFAKINENGVNYFLEYTEGFKISRYNWDVTEEYTPLVGEGEYSEYRELTPEAVSDSESGGILGLGALNYYFLIWTLLLLFSVRRNIRL